MAVMVRRVISEHAGLNEREVQVLHGLSRGLSNREIAAELFLSLETVKTHSKRLFRKLDARGRAHAVSIGFQRGILGGVA